MATDNGLILQNTLFGYVVSGLVPLNLSHSLVCFHAACSQVERLISQFWELEKVPEIYPEYTSEQEACEKIFHYSIHFVNNKFQVDLPLQKTLDDIHLGDSFSIAYRRFENLEKRFKANPEFFIQYKTFIDEYLNLNHAKIVEYDFDKGTVYFMGHYPVTR